MTSPPIPPLSRISWNPTYRIIPSRYPPIDLFERVADPADWDHLANLETLTNPRVRQEWGEISLVPVERRVAGLGSSWVMAPFTHLQPEGSRFSDGSWGVYYASRRIDTAIVETVYHVQEFYAATQDDPHTEQMRVLVGSIHAKLHDIRRDSKWNFAHHPTDYNASQALARALRDRGSDGIVYDSVRYRGGENIAAFWPDVVAIPVQGKHLAYDWNGSAIKRYFDYEDETWVTLG